MMNMRRRFFIGSFVAALMVVSPATTSMVAQATPPAPQAPGQGRGGQGQADPWPNSKKLLAVADVQSGFHHDSISHALATVEQIGRKANAFVTMIRTDSQLITKGQIIGKGRYEGRSVNARTLDYYDAIFMLPSGFGTMTEQQKKELLAFVHDEGKGLIVGHATGVAFTDWPEYAEMVGGYMDSEFNANAKIIVEDPAFPGANAFGGTTFMFNDQHPVFKAPYSRDKVHVIMRLDPESLDATNRARRAGRGLPGGLGEAVRQGARVQCWLGPSRHDVGRSALPADDARRHQVGDGRHESRCHPETVPGQAGRARRRTTGCPKDPGRAPC